MESTFDSIDTADSGNYTCEVILVSPIAGNVSGHSSVISLEIQSDNWFISSFLLDKRY